MKNITTKKFVLIGLLSFVLALLTFSFAAADLSEAEALDLASWLSEQEIDQTVQSEVWALMAWIGDHHVDHSQREVDYVLDIGIQAYCIEDTVDELLASGWEALEIFHNYDLDVEGMYYETPRSQTLEDHVDVFLKKNLGQGRTTLHVITFWGPESDNPYMVSHEAHRRGTTSLLEPVSGFGEAQDYCNP